MRLVVAALAMSASLGNNVAPADDERTFVVVVGADNPKPLDPRWNLFAMKATFHF